MVEKPPSFFRQLYDKDWPHNFEKFADEVAVLIAKGDLSRSLAEDFAIPLLDAFTRNILGRNLEDPVKVCLSLESISGRIDRMNTQLKLEPPESLPDESISSPIDGVISQLKPEPSDVQE